MPVFQPPDADLIGLGCSLGIGVVKSSLSDAHVRPRLRTSALWPWDWTAFLDAALASWWEVNRQTNKDMGEKQFPFSTVFFNGIMGGGSLHALESS